MSSFHAAAAPAPATTARLPWSPKNTGSRASASMRGVRMSDGCDALIDTPLHDPLELGQAGTAVGPGPQGLADLFHIRGGARMQRTADHVEPDAEARANERPGVRQAARGFTRQ